jgi:hypothetical protein
MVFAAMSKNYHYRCFVRASTRHTRKMQEEILTRYNGVMHDDLGDLLKSLRRADAVVVTTLARLAPRQALIMSAVNDIHSKGAFVIEATTGRKSTTKGPEAMQMMADAFAELRGDSKALPSHVASKYAKTMWAKKLANRSSEAEAKTVWQSLKFKDLTNSALLAMPEMRGWTQESAYRRLGSRGLNTGRPRSKG